MQIIIIYSDANRSVSCYSMNMCLLLQVQYLTNRRGASTYSTSTCTRTSTVLGELRADVSLSILFSVPHCAELRASVGHALLVDTRIACTCALRGALRLVPRDAAAAEGQQGGHRERRAQELRDPPLRKCALCNAHILLPYVILWNSRTLTIGESSSMYYGVLLVATVRVLYSLFGVGALIS